MTFFMKQLFILEQLIKLSYNSIYQINIFKVSLKIQQRTLTIVHS